MSDLESLEIRVCLIGDESVGKKSIISRFKILNSSSTTEETPATGKKKDLKTVQKNMNDSFFTKKYSGREKAKLQALINFTKNFTISNSNIDLKFYPISHADNIEFADKINEDDEAIREHKLKFDNMKAEIERVIMKQPENPLSEVKVLFLFVFDLKNFEMSFDKIKIYYEELNKYLNIDKQYFKAFIGNKVDVKNIHIDKEGLQKFIEKCSFNYYEISTKMFFNFEKFFEKLFFDVFESSDPVFSTKYFKERFNFIMTLRGTFSKADRTIVKTDEFPGPQKYDSNVYNVNPAELKPIFGKERFKNKIFVNKKGPIFDYKNEVFLKKQNKTSKPNTHAINPIKTTHKEEKEDFETTEKKRKLKEEMFGHNPGFSLGVKPSQISYRKKRKEEYKKLMKGLDEVFEMDNIIGKENRRSNSARDYDPDRKKNLLKNRIEVFKFKREKVKPMKKVDKKDVETKLNRTTDDSITKSQIETETDRKDTITINKNKPLKNNRTRSHKTIKKEKVIIPGPASYDTRGKIDLTRGYTFGGRHELRDKNNGGPGYLYIESDIDVMLKQPKFASKKNSAPRFKETYVPEVGDKREIEEKLRYMEENRLNELNKYSLKMRDLERKREEALIRKEEKDEIRFRKLEDAIIKKEEKEQQKRISKGLKPIDHSAVNYNQVEECAPKYSMGAKFEKGFLGVQDNFDDPGKLHGLEQSVSYLSKNLTKNLNPLPNYSNIKPNLPSYSIPVADRFQSMAIDKAPGPYSYYPNYNILDNKPGSHKQASMGVSKRFKDFEYSYVPGPGTYKLKGFSDMVIQESQKRRVKKEETKAEVMETHGEVNKFMEMMEENSYTNQMEEIEETKD